VSPRASFLVVQVRPETWRWPLVLPVPLFVLEDALEACAILARTLAWAGMRIWWRAGWRGGWRDAWRHGWRDGWRGGRRWAGVVPASLLVAALDLPVAAIRCLRDQGRFTLAEVRTDGARVAVRLL